MGSSRTMVGRERHIEAPTRKAMRLLIAAPSLSSRDRVERLIGSRHDLHLVSTVGYSELQSAIARSRPDAVVVYLETRHKTQEWRALLPSDVPTVLWVEDPDAGIAAAALANGTSCVVAGEVSAKQLQAAAVAAATGLLAVSANLKDVVRGGPLARARKSEHESSGPEDRFQEQLTTREIEVLEMVVEGLSNKEIAAQLDISAYTVKFHMSSILGKLGASTRTEAASIGLRRGLITI